MPDVDEDLVQRLVATHEKVAAKLNVNMKEKGRVIDDNAIDNSWYNSRIAESIGYQAGHTIGEVLAELLRGLVPSPEEIAAARARAAIVSTPAAIVPAPVAVESPPPGQMTSKEIHVDGLVGHIEDRRAPSPLATEPFSAHVERLGLESDLRDQVREPKLKGPIIA